MEEDLVHQSKAEVASRLLKSRQKRLEWVQNKEREDYDEQQRRDNQDYEDQRQLKLLRAKRLIKRKIKVSYSNNSRHFSAKNITEICTRQ